MSDSIISPQEKIQKALPCLTPSMRQVAEYVHRNLEQSAFIGVEKLAKKAGVSPSTVMRLVHELGYSSYPEFKDDLRRVVMSQLAPADRLKFVSADTGTAGELITAAFRQDIHNLENTATRNGEEAWQAATDLCLDSPHIWVFGARSSFAVAHYAWLVLDQLLGKSTLIASFDNSMPEIIRRVEEGHTGIVIGMPRYLKITIQVAKLLKRSGAKLLAITDGPFSPLARIADVTLFAAYESLGHHNSLIGSIAVVNCLVTLVRASSRISVSTSLDNLEKTMERMGLFER